MKKIFCEEAGFIKIIIKMMWCHRTKTTKKNAPFSSLKCIQFISSNHRSMLRWIVAFRSVFCHWIELHFWFYQFSHVHSIIQFHFDYNTTAWGAMLLGTHHSSSVCPSMVYFELCNIVEPTPAPTPPPPTTTKNKMIQTTDLQAKNIECIDKIRFISGKLTIQNM